MSIPLDAMLRQRLSPAFEAVAGTAADPVLRRSLHAGFQADGALALARRLGGSTRDVAARVLQHARLGDVCSRVEISGPGVINLTVDDTVLGRMLAAASEDGRVGVPLAGRPEVVTVDCSSPNAAKEMHVGHLRSTIILSGFYQAARRKLGGDRLDVRLTEDDFVGRASTTTNSAPWSRSSTGSGCRGSARARSARSRRASRTAAASRFP
jgi:hypothetical protein